MTQINLAELAWNDTERAAHELIVFADGVEASNPAMTPYAQRARSLARDVLRLLPELQILRHDHDELRRCHERLMADMFEGRFGERLVADGSRYREGM